MSSKARKEYVEAVRYRYLNGNREYKGCILSELCAVCGYHRKHAIRLLKIRGIVSGCKSGALAARKRGRKARYSNDVEFIKALRRLWFETDQMCAPNFKAAIPDWLPFFKQEQNLAPEVCRKLQTVSAATIGRLLEPQKHRTKRRGGTKPGSLLRTEIPIRTNYWDVDGPGYMEADTVAHCGGSMSGEFAWTLTLTDIELTWTEMRCVWNKLSIEVRNAIQDIERHLPFAIVAFDSDNGSEFINKALVHYFAGKFIPFTRSRESHKNDNCHVEQKNWSHARQLLGYDRIDAPAVVPLLNDLLRNEVSLLRNHFYPCLKLAEKVRIQSRIKRIYPKPLTPYARVLASPKISDDKKQELRQLHEKLNPLQLQRAIKAKLRRIFSIVRQEHKAKKAS